MARAGQGHQDDQEDVTLNGVGDSVRRLGPAGKVQPPEPAQMLGAGAGLVDAADAPLAAEDAGIGGVFVDAVA